MEILIDYKYREEDLTSLPVEALSLFALKAEGKPENSEVSITFVTDDEIAALNEEYRGKPGPTDVLSFECDNLDDEFAPPAGFEDDIYQLGDIIIAVDVAERQTEEFGTTFEEEISLLLVHGLLHLCGYDHIEDVEAEVMEAREAEILTAWAEGAEPPAPPAFEAFAANAFDLDDDFDDENLSPEMLATTGSFGMMATREGFKSGFVTLVGRPNAGKSTLLNAIMGKKIAITSNTVQTTRHRFRAVLTHDNFQMVLVDTPGLHKPHDALGEELNVSALKALEDVDVVAMLIDASKPIGKGDEWVAEQVKRARAKKICVLSKTDIASESQIFAQRDAAEKLMQWDAMVALSSQSGRNVDAFIEEVEFLLPEGPAWFPADMETDQPIEVVIAEFIREKILRSFHDEVPHAIGVRVDELEFVKKKDLARIFATIYVERDSQKGIIIGKKGAAIKAIGVEARRDLEHLLGTKVFLDLSVKVKKNWRRDANQIRRFGYGEGN